MIENIDDNEIRKKLENINEKIKESLTNISKEVGKNIEEAKQQIKNRVKQKHNFNKILKEYREIPNIQMMPNLENNFNYILNPVLFCLANLEIITQFSLLDDQERKELMKKLGNDYFITKFIDLMEKMRNKNIPNPSYNLVHQHLKTLNLNNYMNQDPAFLINSILTLIQNEINIANNYPNIITNYFSTTLNIEKNCLRCGGVVQISPIDKLVVDLFLREPDVAADEALQSILINLLMGEENKKGTCIYCSGVTDNTIMIGGLKKYLIFNLNRKHDVFHRMKFTCSDPIKLEIKKGIEEYKYEYELISVLTDVHVDYYDQQINLEQNRTNVKVFFKNFINDNYYMKINGKYEEVSQQVFHEEINRHKPNILIYKRI